MKLLVVMLLGLLGMLSAGDPGAAPKRLWWIFLTRGDGPRPHEESALEAMQTAHIDNFKRQHALGTLLCAGPLNDPTKFKRGIVVLKVPSHGEVLQCFQTDPYVQGHIMSVEAHPFKFDFGQLQSEAVDPEKIEEYRLVILRSKDARPPLIKVPHLAASAAFEDAPIRLLLVCSNDGDAVRSSVMADPKVQSGKVTVEILPWWAAKGTLKLP